MVLLIEYPNGVTVVVIYKLVGGENQKVLNTKPKHREPRQTNKIHK